MKSHESKEGGSHQKKPLVIYIAETDHGDMSYSSFLRKVIEDCDSKGLKTKVFSEFGNEQLKSQDEKLMTQASNLSNVPEKEVHESTTELLNERSIPMGNLYERFTQHIPEAHKSLPEDVTPSQLLGLRRGQIDNPETLRLLEAEIRIRQQNQKAGTGEVGNRDSKGKEGKDFESIWGNGNAFVQQMTHQAMAEDVVRKRDSDEDVIIMIAGSPHIYGLDKELGSEFQDCQKLVVGNFREFEVDLSSLESIRRAQHLSGKASCQQVGEVVGFEVGLDKQAVIPSAISEVLEKESKSSFHEAKEAKSQKISLEALDLAKPEEKESKELPKEKSWVEKMADRKLSTSRDGHREI